MVLSPMVKVALFPVLFVVDLMELPKDSEGYILVDLSWVIYRGYFAFKHLTVNYQDEEIRTGHYFYVIKLIRDLRDAYPRHTIILCQDQYPKEKHEVYPEYKAGREHPFDLTEESNRILKFATQINSVYGATSIGREADDVMFSLSRSLGGDIVVYSGDDDLLQCVDLRVKLARKYSEGQFILLGHRFCHEKFGVYPSQLLIYRALRGDRSDNIAGVCPRFPKRIARDLAIRYHDPVSLVHSKIPITKDKTLVKYWTIVKKESPSFFRNYELMKLREVSVDYIKVDQPEFIDYMVDTYKLVSLRGLYRACKGMECRI